MYVFMCAHFMYADFMMCFFTYGCLVRDDLIKKFKRNEVLHRENRHRDV